MDFQTLLNLVAGAALAVTGWFARRLWDAVESLRTDMSQLREELPKTYITKDDFKDEMSEVKEMLRGISTRLDRWSDGK